MLLLNYSFLVTLKMIIITTMVMRREEEGGGGGGAWLDMVFLLRPKNSISGESEAHQTGYLHF